MFKKISSELMTVLISVTVLVVLITSIVFTLLFSDYAIKEKEDTLKTMAENISELVARDEASTSSYNLKSIGLQPFCKRGSLLAGVDSQRRRRF